MDRFERQAAVYIMVNRYRGTLYVGVSSALYLRVCDHKNERFDGCTKQHGVKTLVWHAHFATMEEAISHEKLLKKWHRDWKFPIIDEMNPDWADPHEQIDADITFASARPRPSPG